MEEDEEVDSGPTEEEIELDKRRRRFVGGCRDGRVACVLLAAPIGMGPLRGAGFVRL